MARLRLCGNPRWRRCRRRRRRRRPISLPHPPSVSTVIPSSFSVSRPRLAIPALSQPRSLAIPLSVRPAGFASACCAAAALLGSFALVNQSISRSGTTGAVRNNNCRSSRLPPERTVDYQMTLGQLYRASVHEFPRCMQHIFA